MKARTINYAVTLIIVAVATLAALTLYRLYLANPWTRDGQIRANVVGIAPRVSGPVIHVAVHDNQQVKTGDLLFENTESSLGLPVCWRFVSHSFCHYRTLAGRF